MRLDIGERAAQTPGPGEPAYWWLEGPNQWPDALPELRVAALAWIERLSSVAARLLRELLTAIGAPGDFYEPIFGDRAHPHLKLVRYPGRAGDGGDQGVRNCCRLTVYECAFMSMSEPGAGGRGVWADFLSMGTRVCPSNA